MSQFPGAILGAEASFNLGSENCSRAFKQRELNSGNRWQRSRNSGGAQRRRPSEEATPPEGRTHRERGVARHLSCDRCAAEAAAGTGCRSRSPGAPAPAGAAATTFTAFVTAVIASAAAAEAGKKDGFSLLVSGLLPVAMGRIGPGTQQNSGRGTHF